MLMTIMQRVDGTLDLRGEARPLHGAPLVLDVCETKVPEMEAVSFLRILCESEGNTGGDFFGEGELD